MKLFVISFFLLVNLFMSVSINAKELLHLPNNKKVDDFIINFCFVHNSKFFFENRLFHCPPETEFPKYPRYPGFLLWGYILPKKERDMALKQYEKEKNLFEEFSNKTCQEQAPEIREGDDNFSRTMRHAFIFTCMDFVRYCNEHRFDVYTEHEIDAAIKMLKQGITHNAYQLKHQEKALVKNINSLKATVKSEVENDLTPLFSRLMDKIADLEAKVNQSVFKDF